MNRNVNDNVEGNGNRNVNRNVDSTHCRERQQESREPKPVINIKDLLRVPVCDPIALQLIRSAGLYKLQAIYQLNEVYCWWQAKSRSSCGFYGSCEFNSSVSKRDIGPMSLIVPFSNKPSAIIESGDLVLEWFYKTLIRLCQTSGSVESFNF